MAAILNAYHKWVVDFPEAALKLAFTEAHDAIRRGMLKADPTIRCVKGRDADGPEDVFIALGGR